jgi:hypothetical protein
MQRGHEKPLANGAKSVVKKEGVSSVKSNGVAKGNAEAHGHKKVNAVTCLSSLVCFWDYLSVKGQFSQGSERHS